MKRIFMWSAFITVVPFFICVNSLYSSCPCEYSSYDWAEVTLLQVVPSEGFIEFSVKCYWTCEDGWDIEFEDIPPVFKVYRPGECINEPYNYSYATPGWEDFYKYRYCAVYCGHFPECLCVCPPNPCDCHNHSYHDYTPEFRYMWGTFRIEAWFKGDIIFEQEFEFPEQLPDNKLLSITNIWISDYTGEQVSPNATFDVDESLIIEAVGEWDQDPPENWIFGVIKTDGTNDSLLVPMGLVSGGYQDAFYRGIVGSGNLRQIYPDPENHFGYFDRDLMTVYAKQNGCDAPPNSMTDETYVSIIRIYVDEVDF